MYALRVLVWLMVSTYFNSEIVCLNPRRYYKELTINEQVDHFSFSRNDTFPLRYLVNDTYWNSDRGPIFFYTGNEGAIELFAEHAGFIWDIAEEFQAKIVFAEHRYYGQSLPFGNNSYKDPSHLGFLTSTQALADYVDLISHLQQETQPRKSPVIAFGGSYGGMLSAYLRMKYPNIVVGAIAASAPIHQFQGMVPCDVFSRIASSNFKTINHNCYNNIYKSWSVIRNYTKTAEGKAQLSKDWKLCNNAPKDDIGVQTIIDYLSSMYGTLAMVNYPYESDFMGALPANPVRYVCQYLESSLDGKPLLEAVGEVINTYSNYTGATNCVETSSNSNNPKLGDAGWDFQACTEMVMPMCSTGSDDMFEASPWYEKEFISSCQQRWNVTPVMNLAELEYGGSRIETASNIVFSNGLLDPWAGGGILKNLSDTLKSILIPEGAHHLDLMGANPNDPYSVVLARNSHKAYIKKWINEFYESLE